MDGFLQGGIRRYAVKYEVVRDFSELALKNLAVLIAERIKEDER